MRIVYMGTPEFAVPPLEALLARGHDIAAVVTQPDRPSGRGNKLTACPVKQLALSRGLPVLQFERLRRKEGLAALEELGAELFVTAAFGQILSRKLLDIPPMGTVNLHASLLPAYRGPAPIQWCLIRGEKITGVTTMMTDEGIDTGDMLLSRALSVDPEETAGELTLRLSRLGGQLLAETLERLEAGNCPRTPQDPEKASHYPMLEKEHGSLDWHKPAAVLSDQVRGVSPWPGAYTHTEQGILKIWRVRPVPGEGQPGEVLRADPAEGLAVACGEGALEILVLQATGGKPMESRSYLRGHQMAQGSVWGVRT